MNLYLRKYRQPRLRWFWIISTLVLLSTNIYTYLSLQNTRATISLVADAFVECSTKNSKKEQIIKYLQEHNKYSGRPYNSALADAYLMAANEFKVDPWLLISISIPESDLDPSAISDAGAVGIMQIMPQYWVGTVPFIKERDDLFDPELNIRAGAFIIRYYMDRCGGLKQGLQCYHGGERSLTNPRPSTISHVNNILSRYRKVTI